VWGIVLRGIMAYLQPSTDNTVVMWGARERGEKQLAISRSQGIISERSNRFLCFGPDSQVQRCNGIATED
jgi:hypothetical protein